MNLARFWWALGVLLVIVAAIVCLMPMKDLQAPFSWNDKLYHLVGHCALAAYFAGLVPRARWLRIFGFLLAFGITIEIAQHFMDIGREADVRDVAANTAGALLGLLAARLGLARWPEFAGWLLGQRSEAR